MTKKKSISRLWHLVRWDTIVRLMIFFCFLSGGIKYSIDFFKDTSNVDYLVLSFMHFMVIALVMITHHQGVQIKILKAQIETYIKWGKIVYVSTDQEFILENLAKDQYGGVTGKVLISFKGLDHQERIDRLLDLRKEHPQFEEYYDEILERIENDEQGIYN